MRAEALPTLGDALIQFRRTNGLHADEAARATWNYGFGAVKLVLPNFAWRRKAIEAHDLHHVLTGYPCTIRGEVQMAAWEFGAGPMPHPMATLFCLPLVIVGLLSMPQTTFMAFVLGRRSFGFHGSQISPQILAAPLHTSRTRMIAIKVASGWRDYTQFARLILKASSVLLSPVVFLIGIWIL
jgi:hypothetical protein